MVEFLRTTILSSSKLSRITQKDEWGGVGAKGGGRGGWEDEFKRLTHLRTVTT